LKNSFQNTAQKIDDLKTFKNGMNFKETLSVKKNQCHQNTMGKNKNFDCSPCNAFSGEENDFVCGIDNGRGDDSKNKGNSECYLYCKPGANAGNGLTG